eukprot:s1023_g14.t2
MAWWRNQPAEGNTAGRLFDAMMLGCIPVLLFHPDSYPVLPFVSRIPWHDFAVVASMASEEQAISILQSLLDMPLAERQDRRQRTLRYAPLVALSLQNCPAEVVSALDLISMELEDKVAMIRSAVLPGMQIAAAPRNRDDWLLWGPLLPSEILANGAAACETKKRRTSCCGRDVRVRVKCHRRKVRPC